MATANGAIESTGMTFHANARSGWGKAVLLLAAGCSWAAFSGCAGLTTNSNAKATPLRAVQVAGEYEFCQCGCGPQSDANCHADEHWQRAGDHNPSSIVIGTVCSDRNCPNAADDRAGPVHQVSSELHRNNFGHRFRDAKRHDSAWQWIYKGTFEGILQPLRRRSSCSVQRH